MGRYQANETNGDPTVCRVKGFQDKIEQINKINSTHVISYVYDLIMNNNAFPGDLAFRPFMTPRVPRSNQTYPSQPSPLLPMELVNQHLFHLFSYAWKGHEKCFLRLFDTVEKVKIKRFCVPFPECPKRAKTVSYNSLGICSNLENNLFNLATPRDVIDTYIYIYIWQRPLSSLISDNFLIFFSRFTK